MIGFVTDRRLAPLALLLLLCACGGGRSDKAETPSALVQIATAKAASVSPIVTAYGRIAPDPAEEMALTMPRDVQIASVSVHVGDVVKKDEAIVTVVTSPLAHQQFVQAVSALKAAQQDVERIRRLYRSHLASGDQLAAAQKSASDAVAAVAAQKAIGANLTTDTLRSPMEGVVTALQVSPGDRVQANTVLARVAKLESFIALVGVEPEDAMRFSAGAGARLKLSTDPAVTVAARVATVAKVVNPTSRLVDVLLRPTPADPPAWFKSGTDITADIHLPAEQGVSVPIGALLEDEAGSYVFVDRSGNAHRQTVKVVFDNAAMALISSGIQAGEKVITEGNAALEDGMAVRESKK